MTAPAPRPSSFQPTDIGLSEDFLLTDYARLKGCSCKVPQKKLLHYLTTAGLGGVAGGDDLDCTIRRLPPTRTTTDGEPLFLVSSTDMFTPSVEDPYLQGEIAVANVVSDLCAIGVTGFDAMLMLLASSTDMDPNDRDVTTVRMVRGFVDHCERAGCVVTGGQTIQSPWPIVGGVVSAVVCAREMIPPTGLALGDAMVLTKPLGTQMAVNAKQWTRRPSPIYLERFSSNVDARGNRFGDDDIDAMYDAACVSMRRLNIPAAKMMHAVGAHGATDVTGFGLVAHAANLARAQPTPMAIEIHTLPILRGAVRASELTDDVYRVLKGESAETSGGLLVAVPAEKAAAFIAGIAATDGGAVAWVVGRVVPGNPGASLTADCAVVEVDL